MGRISAIALQRALAEGRRGAARYDIRLALRYSAVRKGEMPRTGAGESLNVSRTGVLLRVDRRGLQTGDSIVVVLDWPISGPDNQPLKLVITGNVVRTKPHLAAVAIHSHRLMRWRDLKNRGDTLWLSAEESLTAAREMPATPRFMPQEPIVLVEDDDNVASILSTILSPQKWVLERADAARAEQLINRGNLPFSLVVTRTRSLLEQLPPQIPGILTIEEDAPEDGATELTLPGRAVVRKPLQADAMYELIQSLIASPRRAQRLTNSGAS